ncbi:MAG: mannonate dehydratase [Imperialibacter sp.]|uniref:mannonate dehydratase n=1 Tax=Imperialibacter sp. TaxID=2038411 RepID=UPI0032EAD23D
MEKSRRQFIKGTASLAALSSLGGSHAFGEAGRRDPEVKDELQICMSYFYGMQPQKLALQRQMGVDGAVCSVSPSMAGVPGKKPWDYETIHGLKDVFAKEGLVLRVLEGPPTLEKTKLGLPGRDEELDNFITFLKSSARAGIDTVCYNWMPVISWHRSQVDKRGRGDAFVTAFNYEDVKDQPLTEYGEISAEKMWSNLDYFLKAIMPEAEKAGIKMAMHPDDPPIPNIRGIARIMTSVEAFKRMLDMHSSPSNGLTFCQGTFATMGEDIPSAIRYFGKRDRIYFVHFRDIIGDKWKFEESFHDNGKTDMYEAMKAYYDIGFKGPIRPDHVPTMEGEENNHPGYGILGNLYAIGYMRGLMEAVSKSN